MTYEGWQELLYVCEGEQNPRQLRTSSMFGLPRLVLNFLRLMEAHKDCLKWNITEGSHKITMTLTWSFRKANRNKESLWDRVQRTLRLSRSVDDGTGLPPELTHFLIAASSPKPQSLNPTPVRSPVRRQLRLTRSFSHTLPQSTPPSRANSYHVQRQASFPTSLSPPTSNTPQSISRFSWPGAGSPTSVRGSLTPATPATPSTRDSSPNISRTESTTSRSSRVRLTYRTEEDIEKSLEDIMEKTKQETKEKLDTIRKEWNQNVRNWPRLVRQGAVCTNTCSSSDSEVDGNIKDVRDTVDKCLSSCDKILYRHSTLIT